MIELLEHLNAYKACTNWGDSRRGAGHLVLRLLAGDCTYSSLGIVFPGEISIFCSEVLVRECSLMFQNINEAGEI